MRSIIGNIFFISVKECTVNDIKINVTLNYKDRKNNVSYLAFVHRHVEQYREGKSLTLTKSFLGMQENCFCDIITSYLNIK